MFSGFWKVISKIGFFYESADWKLEMFSGWIGSISKTFESGTLGLSSFWHQAPNNLHT